MVNTTKQFLASATIKIHPQHKEPLKELTIILSILIISQYLPQLTNATNFPIETNLKQITLQQSHPNKIPIHLKRIIFDIS